jgi:putative ABC transport system permease protein
VVTADQQIHWTDVEFKNGETKAKTKSKPLSEHAWVSGSVGGRLAALPGAKVVVDLVFPADVVGNDGSALPGAGSKPSWGTAGRRQR